MVNTTCPVCGLEEAFEVPESWEICPRCNWEDDPVQRSDPDYWGGANDLSLNQARHAWLKGLDVLVLYWDIHIMSTPNLEESDLGTREEVLRILAKVIPDIDLSELPVPKLRRRKLYMEFVVGEGARVRSMWVLAYGSGDAVGVLKDLCTVTEWLALDTWNTRGGNPVTFLDLGKRTEEIWRKWRQFRNRVLRERAMEAERAGKRLIFTTSAEIGSSKPVEEFEDIRALGGGS